ncbi:MAG: 30S ribosomal protein S3 [Thermotogota bacterium]
MIERKIVQQKIKGYLIENYVGQTLTRVGHSQTTIARSPLGEKITIAASRPGLVVGSKGSNIKKLTKVLKAKFKLDNPQIEIEEVKNQDLDPRLVAENIASSLERFGTSRFKGVGYKTMAGTMGQGALGIEILISGKIPSSRAKRWRFYMGYLKKCGDVSVENVLTAYDTAKLKTGIIGIQVRIMPPGLVLPDSIDLKKEDLVVEIEDEDTGKKEDVKAAKKEADKLDSDNLKSIKEKVEPKSEKKEETSEEVKEKKKTSDEEEKQ